MVTNGVYVSIFYCSNYWFTPNKTLKHLILRELTEKEDLRYVKKKKKKIIVIAFLDNSDQ
jgi:hypothetical protein